MRCGGCNRELEVGDRFIKATPAEFMGRKPSSVDGLVAEMLGGVGGQMAYCEDCTQEGGDFMLETFYGDEDDSPTATPKQD